MDISLPVFIFCSTLKAPSEGDDSVMGKRKNGDQSEAEGSKKKNKKLEYTRPACSWVHFR